MTNKQLIELLKQYPDDLPVYVVSPDDGLAYEAQAGCRDSIVFNRCEDDEYYVDAICIK